MRPDSWTATYVTIRVVPRRVSTSTSTKCAPKHWRMVPSGTGVGVAEATRTWLPVGIPRAAICCCKSLGIHVKRDSWVSVMYAEELNSTTSSVTLQRTDRHGSMGQKSADFQLSL